MTSSQAERLRSMIEEDILSFKLRPGDKLDESRLADKYGTSRTPVREALRQLSASGLVELRPYKGAVVAELHARDLMELLEVLAELEGACGRLAAKACFKSDLDAIEAALERCRALSAVRDWENYRSANEIFHEAIYRASHNSTLLRMVLNVRNRIAPFRRRQVEQLNRLELSVGEHNRIFQAIRDGRSEEADRLLQMHILSLGAEMRQLVAVLAIQESESESGGELVPSRKSAANGCLP